MVAVVWHHLQQDWPRFLEPLVVLEQAPELELERAVEPELLAVVVADVAQFRVFVEF